MAANQPVPSAQISNAADFIARAGEQATGSGNWLGKPPVLAGMLELPTTNLTAGTAVYGGFQAGFAIALRAGLTVDVVRYGKPTSGQHLLIAIMRRRVWCCSPSASSGSSRWWCNPGR
jgi:hypothetical protein